MNKPGTPAHIATTRYVGKSISRIDALEKATGKTLYLSDLSFPDMLWARVLRAKYPHAQILSIDTSRAEALDGVHCVLTHKHVMGLNGFGIAIPDQPVLCYDKVRHIGDAIALVAAEDKEIAEKALELIDVEYEPLPLVDDPELALRPDAPKVHEKGNVLLHAELGKGNINQGFSQAEVIVQQAYRTQMMDHCFLETEGGIGVYDEKTGVITVYCGSQYAYRDQLQIARALKWEPEKIRVCSSPVGGAFGGKDEVTIQIYLALLTYYAKRPVKMVLSREESFITHVKRHPMRLNFKVGATNEGKITALEAQIISDAGAYASLSGPVLNLALEGAPGPYLIPHTRLQGGAVYTNNAISGAMRGFGCTQSCFALEITLDMLAEKLGIDPLEFRLKNVLHQGGISGLDHKICCSVGIEECLKIARESRLWQERNKRKQDYSHPYYYGVGVAAETQALGLGKGIPDYAGAEIILQGDGSFLVRQSNIEIGQGNLTCFAQMAADCLHCDLEKIRLTHGDTAKGPDSGSVTASKSIYLVGNAIYLASLELTEKIEKFATERLGRKFKYQKGRLVPDRGLSAADSLSKAGRMSLREIAKLAAEKSVELKGEGFFRHPESDQEYGDGLPHWLYSYIVQIASVVVDRETGEVSVQEVLSVPDCGRAINIQGVEGQCEGGVVMGMGYALFEQVKLAKGHFQNNNFSTYILPTALDAPEKQETKIVESFEATHPFGAKGIAEPPNVAICPAILNAIYDAVGVRIFEIPVTPEKLLRALELKVHSNMT